MPKQDEGMYLYLIGFLCIPARLDIPSRRDVSARKDISARFDDVTRSLSAGWKL